MLLKRLEDECKQECRRADPADHRAGPGRGQGKEPADHPAGDPALRRGADLRSHRQHGDHSQRRHEGPGDRPRGTQHPQLRESDRRGCDHRRHAGRGGGELFRSGPPRDRPDVAGTAGAGRPHPSGPHRGSRRRHQQGNGGGADPHRQGSGPGGAICRTCPSRSSRCSAGWATAPATARTC